MGRQVNFFAVDQDHVLLLNMVRDMGFLALPVSIPVETTIEPVEPSEFRLPEGHNSFYLAPDIVTNVGNFYRQNPYHPASAFLNQLGSPVISFMPSLTKDKNVYDGRFYLDTNPNTPHYGLIEKAYNKLARYIRKWVKTSFVIYYVGPHTAQRVRSQEIRLIHIQAEFSIEE